ncbi:hypothetical protein TSOC_010205 [Tetrabaena socialis]|uniref:Uncharacterized protein n=1 Tax=Tetrabaena socialis TaxID=47790 RepID=A0A2J7ZTV5_9CHLO|nr:hypothetical protein TSOC_010205 [Tetrabaena socialis]|eukprot:PNH03692.1 hypothetical protein TSOC_010205 [Tetrabaena socialis]
MCPEPSTRHSRSRHDSALANPALAVFGRGFGHEPVHQPQHHVLPLHRHLEDLHPLRQRGPLPLQRLQLAHLARQLGLQRREDGLGARVARRPPVHVHALAATAAVLVVVAVVAVVGGVAGVEVKAVRGGTGAEARGRQLGHARAARDAVVVLVVVAVLLARGDSGGAALPLPPPLAAAESGPPREEAGPGPGPGPPPPSSQPEPPEP